MKRKSNRRGRRQRGYRGLLWVLAAGLLLFGLIAQQNILLGTSSRHALLMDARTGQVLARKRSGEEAAPASLTKMMTVLLAAEALPDLDTPVTLPEDIFPALYKADASMAGFQPGETVTVRDLLYGAMLPSGAECCEALARQVSGSEEAFVARMNERAKELGMHDTHFLNCTGLPAEGHVTSAYDIALMSRELILNHPDLRRFTTTWMDSLRNGESLLVNTNKLVRFYPGATGLKTGSTDSAKYCISATAEKDGMELIAVILGGSTSDKRFSDAKALLNYGFAAYSLVTVTPESPLPAVPVTLGTQKTVQSVLTSENALLLEKSRANGLTQAVSLPESIDAPVEEGEPLGTLDIFDADGTPVASLPLLAGESIPHLTWSELFCRLLKLAYCGA